jgi:hypothetical protein
LNYLPLFDINEFDRLIALAVVGNGCQFPVGGDGDIQGQVAQRNYLSYRGELAAVRQLDPLRFNLRKCLGIKMKSYG